MTRARRLMLSLFTFVPSAAVAAEPAPSPDRAEFVFLAKTRPVRVQIQIRQNGKPLADAFDANVAAVLDAFDRDRDGSLSPAEAKFLFPVDSVRDAMVQGFANTLNGRVLKTPDFAAIDADDDGKISRDELVAYYRPARKTGMVTPFPVPPNDAGTGPVSKDLFARLDTNGDGRLSKAELAAAERALLAIDTDDDECVSFMELQANPFKPLAPNAGDTGGAMMPIRGGMMGRPTPNGINGAQFADATVYPSEIPGNVVQQILRKYDKDGDFELTREEIGFDAATFERIDRNRSGKITATELDAWRTGTPDLIVGVGGEPGGNRATVTAGDGGAAGFEAKPTSAGDRATLRVGAQPVDVGASSPIRGYNPRQAGFYFPPNKNEITSEDLANPQFQFFKPMFEAADFDGDGKLTKAEAQKYHGLVVGFAEIGQAVGITVRTPNFFQALDENGDGRLSVRELRSAHARLAALDPDGHNEITEKFLQPAVTLRVGQRMNVQSDQSLYGNFNQVRYVAPGQPAPGTAVGPIWFRKLDRNADGDLSPGEFVGAKSDFAKIDSDGDGLISRTEAEAYETKVRPEAAKLDPKKLPKFRDAK